jgi:hypothetical protein
VATLTGGGLSGAVSGDAVTLALGSAQASFADRRAGAGKTVTASGLGLAGADASNYVLGSSTAQTTASITARELTLGGVSAQDKVYDGSTVATLTGTPQLQGVVSGDAVSADLSGVSGAFADRRVGTGKAVSFSGLSLSGADAGNYALSGTLSSTASITARELGVVDLKAADRVYDGSTVATLTGGGLSGTVSGDAVTLALGSAQASFADRRAGAGKTVTASGLGLAGADASNYVLGSSTAQTTASITARELTLGGVSAQDKVYDGSTVATLTGTPQLQGAVSGDAVSADLSGVSGAFADRRVGTGKAVSFSGLSLSGADAGNYALSGTLSSTASITARQVTITGLSAVDRVYDGGSRATLAGGVLQGTIAGDAVSIDTGASDARFADKSVGANKPVSVTGLRLAGADAVNYSLTSSSASLQASISVRTLNVAFSGIDKVYDGTVAAQVSASDDRVPGDQLDIDRLAVFPDRHAGAARPVAVTGIALRGTDAANYSTASSASTTATISVRPLATWTATSAGSWTNAANWDALPDRGNVEAVSIPAGASVSFDGSVPVTLASLANAGTLMLAGAGLEAARIDNSGQLVIAAGAIVDLGSRAVLGSGTVSNQGSLRLDGATVANRLENAGTLELRGSSTLGAFSNVGSVTLFGGTTTFGGAYLQRAGSTELVAAGPGRPRLVVPSGIRVEGGRFGGNGAIDGPLDVAGGTLAPGASPGSLSIDGSLGLGADSRLAIELGGTATSLFDNLTATGALTLGGTLEASTHQGFRPAPADTFDIMRGASVSGRFALARTDDPLLLGFNFRNLRIVTPDGSIPLPADRMPLSTEDIAQTQLAALTAGRASGAGLSAAGAVEGNDGLDADGAPLTGSSMRAGGAGSSAAGAGQADDSALVRRSVLRSLELPDSASSDEEFSNPATGEVRYLRGSRSRSRGSGC